MKWAIFGYTLLLAHLPAIWFTPYGLVAAYSLGVGAFGLFRWWESRRAMRWPTVSARVVRSEVIEGAYLDQGDLGTYDAPDVGYEYEVAGRTFRGELLRPGDQFKTRVRWLAERWARRYPVGSSVAVHVNPARPEESALQASPIVPWLLPLAGGLGGFAVVATMFREAVGRGVPTWIQWNYATFFAGLLLIAFIAREAQREQRRR